FVTTWLIPHQQGHIRLHRVETQRALDSVEGGFAINRHLLAETSKASHEVALNTLSGCSQIVDLLCERHALTVTTAPNSHILHAAPGEIPCLGAVLEPGTHWLACAVTATMASVLPPPMTLAFDRQSQVLTLNTKTLHIQ